MKNKGYILFLIVFGIVAFAALEAYLRHTGRYKTFYEATGRPYASYYNQVLPTWYLTRTPGEKSVPFNSDFRYAYSINSLGLREKEFEKNKPDSVIRIFVAGDSFSDGEGAPVDSTWPHLFGKYLVQNGVNAEVLNVGVAGSDPLYNYTLYRDYLKNYQSDYLILPFNSSDFTDYLLRGGFERFHIDGTTHFKKGPWYEAIYKYSHFSRAVIERLGGFPFRGTFSNEKEMAKSADEAIACYTSAIDSFNQLAAKRNTKIIVLLYSTPGDIRFENKENLKYRQCFLSFQDSLSKRNIPSINLWDKLKTELKDKDYHVYSYPNDSHFNPWGYNLMASYVTEEVMSRKLINQPAK